MYVLVSYVHRLFWKGLEVLLEYDLESRAGLRVVLLPHSLLASDIQILMQSDRLDMGYFKRSHFTMHEQAVICSG